MKWVFVKGTGQIKKTSLQDGLLGVSITKNNTEKVQQQNSKHERETKRKTNSKNKRTE